MSGAKYPPRLNLRALTTGTLIAVWAAAVSGWQLPQLPSLLLPLHLLSSTGGLIWLAEFIRRHWWQRRHGLARHANAHWGLATLACLISLISSGSALLLLTNLPWLRRLHAMTAGLFLGVLTFHIAWRLRRWLAQTWQNHLKAGIFQATRLPYRPFSGGWALRHWLFSGGLVAALLLPAAGAGALMMSRMSSVNKISIVHASLQGDWLPSSSECVACHADQADQWSASSHAHAASDSYYQSLASMFVQERGVEAARYCAACHASVGLMQGEVVRPTQAKKQVEQTAAQAYAARALGDHLELSSQAAEGVSCAVCHLAAGTDPAQNAGLFITSGSLRLPGNGLSRLALRSAPQDHRRQLNPAVLKEAALCGSCHNLHSPTGLLLEPTYQEWLDSSYPEQGKTCQSCHFPPIQARLANSSPLTTVAAHGGSPGAPSSLPGVAMSTDLLHQAAQLSLQTTPGAHSGELEVTVTITNTGAGHYLPTGADDLRQVWLEINLMDASGNQLWGSGGLDHYGELSPGTVQFHKVLGDERGHPIELHRFWVATQILQDTRLAPREARHLSFSITLPTTFSRPLHLTARLRYRDVSATFAAFALDRPVPDLAVFEIVHQEIEINPGK